jgi:TonB-dependent receptor
MSRKTLLLLCSAALIPLIAASPAIARQTGAAAVDPADGATVEEVVVTGFRAALGSAQDIKRTSESIVDAVVSEDIGKLPDNNAAEAISRVPGVQVLRYNDEAGQILVRGLPDVATTFNGREFFTADDRVLHLQDFPAGVAAGLEVYKSGTSDLIEPGLAGLVNLRSRRPFDVKDVEIAGEIRASYNDQSKKFDPAGNLLATKRWDTSIGEIGALINVSYVRTVYRNADRYADSAIVSPAGFSAGDPADDLTVATPGVGQFRFPATIGNFYESGTRHRPAVNGTLQWRPTPNLELYAEGLWQAYRGKVMHEGFNVNLVRPDPDGVTPTLSNVVLVPGEADKAASLTRNGGYTPEFFRSTQNDQTDTYQGALGFKWTAGRATLSGDFAYTNSRYTASEYSLDAQFASAPTVNVDFDVKGSAVFDLAGYDSDNPANYVWRGYYERDFVTKGDGYQGRVDLAYDTRITWLPKLQVGLRATDRTSEVRSGNRYAYTAGLGLPLTSLPTGALELVTDGYRGDPQRFQNWLMPSRQSIRDNAGALRALSRAALPQLIAANPGDQGLRDALTRFGTDAIPVDPLAGFSAKEASYAGYVQGAYDLRFGDIDVDGTVGVRVVNTDGTYSGFSRVVDPSGAATIVPTSASQDYTDVLPSFQSRIRFSPEWQMRLAFTQTRTRPGFGQLNPSLNITQNSTSGGSTSIYNAFGSGGNPDLKPLTSNNYDATLEYYFSKNGSASVAVFYRDLDGFISNYTRDVTDPVYGLIQINRPENAGAGRIKGAEASAQTFFDFLPGWLSGFGAQANLTYLDGTNALPTVLGEGARSVRITGLSKWTYNLTAFYERDKISARLSYNHRSDFITSYNRGVSDTQYAGEITRGVSRLDFSLAYEPVKDISIVANVSNILAKPFNNYRYYNETQSFGRDLRIEGRYMSLGVRFKM